MRRRPRESWVDDGRNGIPPFDRLGAVGFENPCAPEEVRSQKEWMLSSAFGVRIGFTETLIDFDYCRRTGVDRYPPDWNHTFRHADAVGGALMDKEHDEVTFDHLFRVEMVARGGGMFRQ